MRQPEKRTLDPSGIMTVDTNGHPQVVQGPADLEPASKLIQKRTEVSVAIMSLFANMGASLSGNEFVPRLVTQPKDYNRRNLVSTLRVYNPACEDRGHEDSGTVHTACGLKKGKNDMYTAHYVAYPYTPIPKESTLNSDRYTEENEVKSVAPIPGLGDTLVGNPMATTITSNQVSGVIQSLFGNCQKGLEIEGGKKNVEGTGKIGGDYGLPASSSWPLRIAHAFAARVRRSKRSEFVDFLVS